LREPLLTPRFPLLPLLLGLLLPEELLLLPCGLFLVAALLVLGEAASLFLLLLPEGRLLLCGSFLLLPLQFLGLALLLGLLLLEGLLIRVLIGPRGGGVQEEGPQGNETDPVEEDGLRHGRVSFIAVKEGPAGKGLLGPSTQGRGRQPALRPCPLLGFPDCFPYSGQGPAKEESMVSLSPPRALVLVLAVLLPPGCDARQEAPKAPEPVGRLF
jgi:hypothetical protein